MRGLSTTALLLAAVLEGSFASDETGNIPHPAISSISRNKY